MVLYKDRLVKTDKFVVGIDPQKFDDTLKKPEVQARIKELGERYKDVKVILGVDRLDYIKGLVQKLHGFEQFLSDNPEWVGKVVLIQVAVPSREDVKEYQELETEISCTVGKINGKFSMLGHSSCIIVLFLEFWLTFYRQTRIHADYIPPSFHTIHRADGLIFDCRCLSSDVDSRWHEPCRFRVRCLSGGETRRPCPFRIYRRSIVYARW
jgi:hypothetical protein